MGEPLASGDAEPADADWLQAAAESALHAGQFQRARALLGQAAQLDLGITERCEFAQIAGRLSFLNGGNVAEALTSLAALIDDAATVDCALAARMLVDATVLSLWLGDYPRAFEHATRAAQLAEATDDSGTKHLTAVTDAVGRVMTGVPNAPTALAEAYRAVLAERSIAQTIHLLQIVVIALGSKEQYAECVRLSREAASQARELGALGPLPIALCLLANLGFYAGEWTTAAHAAAEALHVATRVDQPATMLYAHICQSLVAGARGRRDDCHSHVETARALMAQTGVQVFRETAYLSLGLLALGAEDYETAARELEGVTRGVPMVLWPFLPDYAEALMRCGRTQEAERWLQTADEFAAATGNKWARAGVLRVQGLNAPTGFDALFTESVALFDNTFERGRTHLYWAERLTEDGRRSDAQAHMAKAVDLFTAMQASAWLRRAQCQVGADQGNRDTFGATDSIMLMMLGDFAISTNGHQVDIKYGVPTQAVKIVAVHGGRMHADELAEVLWPESDSGRTRLRTVLQRVRATYGPLLVRAGDEVYLSPAISVDAHDFERLAKMALRDGDVDAARRAVEIYVGELLPVDRYHDWSVTPRERLRLIHLDLLELLATKASEPAEAAGWLERACAVDGFDDRRYVRAAKLWLQAGRHGRAREMLARAETAAREVGAPAPPSFEELLTSCHTARTGGESSDQIR